MKLKELKNTVVHLPTQEEYDEYMQIVEDAGWVWCDSVKPTGSPDWGVHESETCVEVTNNFMCGKKEDYKLNKNKIITLQEFKEIQGIERSVLDVKQGDILVNEYGNERKVLGVCGEAVFVSVLDDFNEAQSYYYTPKELQEDGYKIKVQKKYAYDENGEVLGELVDGKIIK